MTGPAPIAALTAVATTASVAPAKRTTIERMRPPRVSGTPRIRVRREHGFTQPGLPAEDLQLRRLLLDNGAVHALRRKRFYAQAAAPPRRAPLRDCSD